MEYIFATVVLFILMLIYFRIADKYNIIDKPNHRSAHTEITLRGGGVVFPLAFLLFIGSLFFNNVSILEPQNCMVFGTGLFIIAIISFIDDIMDLSSKIRLVFHFISVTLLLYFINAFQLLPFWIIPIAYILIIGILNAYNFMDGINGMTGLYSLVTLITLYYINEKIVLFTSPDFIIYPALASVVFLFFNFRKKAKCFMGDVGSMGIAFWILSLLGLLMIKTGEFKWILFLVVYGVETVLTIIERLRLKENIFDAHRRHLYQLLANDKKMDHRIISLFYAAIQLVFNVAIILSDLPNYFIFPVVIFPAAIVYLLLKSSIKKQISEKKL